MAGRPEDFLLDEVFVGFFFFLTAVVFVSEPLGL